MHTLYHKCAHIARLLLGSAIDARENVAGPSSRRTMRASQSSVPGTLDEAMTICRSEITESGDVTPAGSRPHGPWEPELTERELQVLRLIAAGGTNKDVAAALRISAKTVMHHGVAIYRKLGVRRRAEATAWAYRSNLVGAVKPG
jgi:DNA-binding NarL/FixJ family response regulator